MDDEVGEVVLVLRSLGRVDLFEVGRWTELRVYGREVLAGGMRDRETFVARSAVIKRHATRADLLAILTARGERDRRIRDALDWYRRRLGEITAAPTGDVTRVGTP